MLKKDYPTKVGHSVSHTTRAPRPGEKDGKSYHFVTLDRFEQLVHEDKFIETAIVHGERYGTTFEAVKDIVDKSKLCIMDVDVQGCQSIRRVGFDAFLLFIAPPSVNDLVARLKSRGTESDDSIAVRLETASAEMEFLDNPMWDRVLVNDNLQECYSQLKTFVNSMEPCI